MSYILDALQRADAERARGGVPGLHARQVIDTTPQKSGVARLGYWWLLAAIVLVVAVAGTVWLRSTPAVSTSMPVAAEIPTPRAVAANTPALVPVPVPAPASAPVQAQTPLATPAPTPAQAPVATPTPTPTQTPAPAAVFAAAPPPTSQPAKMRAVAPIPTPIPAQAPGIAVKPATSAVATSPTSTAPAVAAIPWFAELPQDIRQQIPKLTITGTVYSENPGQRLLVVNGQVLTQGGAVTPELTLLEIHPTNSEFVFRGTRFRMSN